MSETENPNPDPLLTRVGEVSLRMMARTVPADTVQHLQARLYAQPDEYPWEDVVDAVLADPVDPSELLNRGLQGQRDWVLRGGAAAAPARPGGGARTGRPKTLKVRGKTLVAAAIVRSGFFVLYTAVVVGILILLRHKFPWFDIYRVLEWLREVLPGVFGPR
ncbi:MAG: hypothetical protein KDB80_14830 [Planctomycetes bacterium]|nr:hypothetical protein [Planctomycetota bacterium]